LSSHDCGRQTLWRIPNAVTPCEAGTGQALWDLEHRRFLEVVNSGISAAVVFVCGVVQ